jgi:hypothetical protein
VFTYNVVTFETRLTALSTILTLVTDHVDLLKGKAEVEKDALDTRPAGEPQKAGDKDVDDELANMMSGLGIEAKCTVCLTVYDPSRPC